MSNSGTIHEAANQPEIVVVEDRLPAFLDAIREEFITAHALVIVSYRMMDEYDDEVERGAAMLVLRQGVQALNKVSDQFEQANMARETGGAT